MYLSQHLKVQIDQARQLSRWTEEQKLNVVKFKTMGITKVFTQTDPKCIRATTLRQ